MFRIAVVEDDRASAQRIRDYIQRYQEESGEAFQTTYFTDGADAVISSFNYIGTTWSGANNALLNEVLRDEWGFRGMVLTDFFGGYGYMNMDQAIRNGGDVALAPYNAGTNELSDQESATSILAARQACKNIMYTVVNSRTYNEENLNPGMPTWQIIEVVLTVVNVALLAFWEYKMIVNYRKYAKKKYIVCLKCHKNIFEKIDHIQLSNVLEVKGGFTEWIIHQCGRLIAFKLLSIFTAIRCLEYATSC